MADAYMRRILQRYGVSSAHILATRSEYLTELVDRAVARRKPFNDSGQQFRDALIWLTILDLGRVGQTLDVAFISGNTRDFAHESRLHPALLMEAQGRGVNVLFYPTIDAFLREHAEKIAFVTPELIVGLLPMSDIEENVIDYYADGFVHRQLERWFMRKFDDAVEEDVRMSSVDLGLVDYYVYARENGRFTVIASYEGQAEVWGYVRTPDHDDYRYGRIEQTHEYAPIQVQIDLDLHGDQLEDWQLTESYVG